MLSPLQRAAIGNWLTMFLSIKRKGWHFLHTSFGLRDFSEFLLQISFSTRDFPVVHPIRVDEFLYRRAAEFAKTL
jgi:hypothetical protein